MKIAEFISQFTNHPILFVGTGISLRYLNQSYTWDGLLSTIALELYGNDETYLDIKARCTDEYGNFRYEEIASIIENDFNSDLQRRENRNGKFKEVNDIYYENMRKGLPISRFKIYLSQILNSSEFNPAKEEEIAHFKSMKRNVSSIITTNYDKLIEDSFGFEPLIGNDILLSNPYGSVYKIHGCIDHPHKMIITKNDYEDFDNRYDLIRAQLLSLFIHNPIIFIGYNIQDENIKKILKTIFSYVEPNSELARKIKNNFLLIEYEPNSNNLNVTDYDVEIDGFPTIRINKIRTDNFTEIFKAVSSLQLPLSVMDIRKVQSIVGEIIKGDTGVMVNIVEDIDNLENNEKVLYIGGAGSIQYAHLSVDDFIAKYFKFIDENDATAISLIDKLTISAKQFFPIYGFSTINHNLACAENLKVQQLQNLQSYMQKKHFERCKTEHTSVKQILEDNEVAVSYKSGCVMWGIWNDRISLEELREHLIGWENKKESMYRRLLCVYDYKKYGN